MKRLNNRPKPKNEFSDMLTTDLCELFLSKLENHIGKKLSDDTANTLSKELADEVVNMLTNEVEE